MCSNLKHARLLHSAPNSLLPTQHLLRCAAVQESRQWPLHAMHGNACNYLLPDSTITICRDTSSQMDPQPAALGPLQSAQMKPPHGRCMHVHRMRDMHLRMRCSRCAEVQHTGLIQLAAPTYMAARSAPTTTASWAIAAEAVTMTTCCVLPADLLCCLLVLLHGTADDLICQDSRKLRHVRFKRTHPSNVTGPHAHTLSLSHTMTEGTPEHTNAHKFTECTATSM